MAAAIAGSEAARMRWVKDGLVVRGEQPAQAWRVTRQALAPSAVCGEIRAVKVAIQLHYPKAFMDMDREATDEIYRALGDFGASETLTNLLLDQ